LIFSPFMQKHLCFCQIFLETLRINHDTSCVHLFLPDYPLLIFVFGITCFISFYFDIIRSILIFSLYITWKHYSLSKLCFLLFFDIMIFSLSTIPLFIRQDITKTFFSENWFCFMIKLNVIWRLIHSNVIFGVHFNVEK
jgi:hypothetical protein